MCLPRFKLNRVGDHFYDVLALQEQSSVPNRGYGAGRQLKQIERPEYLFRNRTLPTHVPAAHEQRITSEQAPRRMRNELNAFSKDESQLVFVAFDPRKCLSNELTQQILRSFPISG